jgi:hypothetical protein
VQALAQLLQCGAPKDFSSMRESPDKPLRWKQNELKCRSGRQFAWLITKMFAQSPASNTQRAWAKGARADLNTCEYGRE